MPFVSKAQQGYMFSHHPKIAKEMAHKTGETGGGTKKSVAAYHKLPAKATPSKGTPSRSSSSRGRSTAPVHVPSKSIHTSHARGKAMAKRGGK
jgi:hypothetical protein